MSTNRRGFLALGIAAVSAWAPRTARAAPAPISALGIDAAQFGVRPGGNGDQSRALQRAVDESARTRMPLALAPGVYRVGGIKLATGAQLIGVRGATRLQLGDGPSLLESQASDHVSLSGLVFDGLKRPLPQGRGLLHFQNAKAIRIADCEIADAAGNAIHCIGVDGQVTDNVLTGTSEVAIHSIDARGLLIARNTIVGAGNNGIQVWRSSAGDDGTIVADNRIEAIENRSGGSGQYGNAVNVFRAGNVIIRANQIRNCAFSAVRGNAASNIQIESNAISQVREVALYSEFGFEGALIAGNTVDGAAIGVSVTNFNEGGRLAVIQGNIIRNLAARRPAGTDPNDSAGVGISAEADTAISGNVIENAPTAGIMLGFGRYLRDVAATGNVVRRADIGIAVSVSAGAGPALIADNLIAESVRGAVMGMDGKRIATGDLLKGGAERYAFLTLSGNRVR